MPKVEKGKKGQGASTTLRHFRADDELWLPFGEASDKVDKDKSLVLRELMAWFAGLAELPERPDMGSAPTAASD
jgi:hypothetical protein